ncbi:MAG: helix-turn-helix domain-containing protein, partial [Usitatibacter sp.]
HFINKLIRQVRVLTENVRSLALMDAYGRVARLLLESAIRKDGLHYVPERLTQAEIASRVGCSREMVSRIFKDLVQVPDAGLGTWIVRGFGTAIMHGGATALFSVMGLTRLEREDASGLRAWMPGLAVAILLHAAFNQFLFSPLVSTALIVVVVPVLVHVVFAHSEKAVGDWLGKGFDADAEMLRLINSGGLAASPVGRYLHELKGRFHGPVVADLLCYLRIYTELSLRAKGILMMRENGFEAPVDEEMRERFAELEYLQKSIGRTGLLALDPMLHMGRKELWQLYMLGK